MGVYKIPVTWEVYGVINMVADSIEEAIAKEIDWPYPVTDGNVDGSREVNLEMIEYLNPGEKVSDEEATEYYKQKEFKKS